MFWTYTSNTEIVIGLGLLCLASSKVQDPFLTVFMLVTWVCCSLTQVYYPSSSSSSGRHPHSAASSHSCRGGTSCLWHNEETPASLWPLGRHHINTFHVSLIHFGHLQTSVCRTHNKQKLMSAGNLSNCSWRGAAVVFFFFFHLHS